MSPGGLGCGSGACGALSRPSPVPPPRLGLGALSLDAGPATAPSRTWVAAPHQASPSRPRQSGHISSRVCLPGPRAPGTERPAPPGLPGTSGRTPRPHRGRHQAPSAALASPWTVVLEAAQAQLWRHGVTPCAAHTRDPCPAVQQARPGDPEHPVLTGSETSPPQAQRAASVPPRCPALTAGGWQGSADHLPGTAEGHSSSDTCLFGRGGAGTQAQGQLGWPGRSQSQQGRDATSPGPSAPRRAHPRCRATQGPSRGVTRPLSQARDPCDQPAPCCVLKDASRLDTLHLGHLQHGSRGALAWGAGQGGRGGPRRYLCLLRGTARPACWCASGRRTRPRRG